ncbi:TonB family protein [Oceanobacter sp. 3_MG-2023]|uniref:TonB family protein n=1 Tax=Oceanobacter sp. 3_MG-2023 TaxID=3062622 RepID=UPI002733868F|nr:TonB family protein [Oceanobacter sp. 3_MG-2023]MDP2504903.1 TonB family protein [Oceanobacter sp. 3_MG-2023]
MRLVSLCLFLLLSMATIEAAELESHVLELQGVAVYQRLDNDVYLASVYSASGSSDSWLHASQPLRLEMHILAEELSPRRFYRLWNEGLAINLSEEEMNQRVTEVTRFMHLLKDDLLAGDHLVISNESNQTLVSVNGVELLQLDDPGFVRALVAAWVGQYPRSQKFKDDLVHMSADQRQLQEARLLSIQPAPGRQQVIKGWLAASKPPAQPVRRPSRERLDAAAAVVAPVSAPAPASASTAAATEHVVASTVSNQAAPETAIVLDKTADTAVELPDSTDAMAEDGVSPLEAESTADAAVDVSSTEQSEQQQQLEIQAVAAQAAAELAAQQAQRMRQEALQIEQQQAETRYYQELLTSANGKVLYPKQAVRRGLEGTTQVTLKLQRDGQLVSAVVSDSSGHEVLDSAAVRAAERAAPYQALPDVLSGSDFEFDIPFRFVMNAR